MFVICPLVGLYFLIKGIIAYIKTKEKMKIIIGIIFLLPPVIHSLIMAEQKNTYEKNVIGVYNVQGTQEGVLEIKSNNTFKLKKINHIESYGDGTWTLIQWDIVELNLHFSNITAPIIFEKPKEKSLSFAVDINGNTTILTYFPENKNKLTLIKR